MKVLFTLYRGFVGDSMRTLSSRSRSSIRCSWEQSYAAKEVILGLRVGMSGVGKEMCVGRYSLWYCSIRPGVMSLRAEKAYMSSFRSVS